jgi:flotillin
MIIDVAVENAYSLGGIPLSVQGVANIKIAAKDPTLGNAVERLMGKSRDEVIRIAKEILEGNLRGVLSQLTPEEVNEDKIKFAEKLLVEADQDLSKLGLSLDTMKIQAVHDDRGYLDSIGRQKSAEIVKTARIAEARAKADAIQRDATNRQRARLREFEANQQVAEAKMSRRIVDAETRSMAMVAEAVGQVQAQIARAQAALKVEEARVKEVELRLKADVIEPAQANMTAGIAQAEGKAARILEEGRATVEVLRQQIEVWKAAGENARDVFLMQKLNVIMQSMVSTLGTVRVDRLTMLPSGGDGSGTAAQAARLAEEIKGAVGVDVPALVNTLGGAAAAISASTDTE